MLPRRSTASDGSPKVKGTSGEGEGTKLLVKGRPPSCETANELKKSWVKASPRPGMNSTTELAEELKPTTMCFPSLAVEVSLSVANSNGRVLTTDGSNVTM